MLTQAIEPTRLECIEVTPGISLRVHDWEEGRPIVLIPGWPLSDAVYDHQMSELAKTGFRAISIPLQDFKKTDGPWETYAYYVFAGDIVAIANHLDLSAVTLGGHAMGGAIAIHYSTCHDGHNVSRLALFGAPAPVWTKGVGHSRQQDVPGSSEDIQAIEDDRTAPTDGPGINYELDETTLNPGVAAWFLCQGRSPGTASYDVAPRGRRF
jgi:non-heme chloroperoxidase